MDRLRHAHLLARAVLAWFVFTIVASVAAPVFQSSALQSICSGSGGLVLVEHGGAPDTGASPHSLQCPLCASFSAPPLQSVDFSLPIAAQTLRETPSQPPRLVPTAAPQPARGPPHRT